MLDELWERSQRACEKTNIHPDECSDKINFAMGILMANAMVANRIEETGRVSVQELDAASKNIMADMSRNMNA